MSVSTAERAAHYATAVADCINLMTYLGSPRSIARIKQMPLREQILSIIDEYLVAINESEVGTNSTEPILLTIPYARKLRELCNEWPPTPDVPLEIVHNARALVAAFWGPKFPKDWQEFEAYLDEMSSDLKR